jgi:hypothetical protein
MSSRKLIVLGIVAVLMVVWAVVQSRISGRPGAEPNTPVYLIQGLDPADIDSIVLGAGDDAVTLKRIEGRFVVANKDNYPAVAGKINDLITSCLDIRTSELYTDEPANHKDLGVTEQDARSVVKFFRHNSEPLVGVVIGNTKEQGQGSFVRLTSSDKVYVTLKSPWIDQRAVNYIDQQLFSLDRKDIESVTVTGPNDVYTLHAKQGQGIVLEEPLPQGKKLKGSDYEQVFNALTSLRFDDVKKASKAQKDLNFDRQYICRLKNSTVYTIKVAQKNDKMYITCDAEFTDKTPVTKEKEVESQEQLKEKEARLIARDKAKEFSGKHNGWVYVIAESKAKNLTKRLSELLEDVTEDSAEVDLVGEK